MINKLLSIFMAVTMLSSSFSPIDKNSFNSIIGYFSNIFQNFENEEENGNWDKNLYEEYNKAMIVDRNKGMTEYAEQALKSGKEIFICVGAAHVVGKGAMAEQLRDLGYTVEVIR